MSFLILASIVTWMMAYPAKVSDWIKSVMIVIILWYGLVVYYTPSKMMGWPYTGEPPKIGVILSWKVVDPARDPKNAGIYIWMVPKREEKEYSGVFKSLIPMRIFSPKSFNIPRAYKFPYSLDGALNLIREGKKLKEGDILTFRKGKKDEEPQYELIEFEEVFTKENGQEGR